MRKGYFKSVLRHFLQFLSNGIIFYMNQYLTTLPLYLYENNFNYFKKKKEQIVKSLISNAAYYLCYLCFSIHRKHNSKISGLRLYL